MEEVSKVYRTRSVETTALRNFSLEVSEGEFVTGPGATGVALAALEVISSDRFAEVAPLAGLPPVIDDACVAQQRLETRKGAHAGVRRGPKLPVFLEAPWDGRVDEST